MRKARPSALTPAELRFDLGGWLLANTIVEGRGSAEWLLQCPGCGRAKLSVNIARRAYLCWVCGLRGWSPTPLVAAILDVSWTEAGAVIEANGVGRALGPVAALRVASRRRVDPGVAPVPRGATWGLDGAAAAYAAARGISPAHATAFGLGYVRDDGSATKANRLLRGRILFPAWTPGGVLAFWQARDTTGRSNLKIVGAPLPCRDPETHPEGCACVHEDWGLPSAPLAGGKEETVMGLHLLCPGGTAIVVEGPVDAAVCGPGFVATWGASMSPSQAALIAGSGVADAVVLYDGDEAGHRGTHGLGADGRPSGPGALGLLAALLPARAARPPLGEDPGSLGRERALALVAAALPAGVAELCASPRIDARVISRSPCPFVDELGKSDHVLRTRHRL